MMLDKNQRVLIRVDFNVPVNNGVISDSSRINSALPTIRHFLNLGMSVVLMSHFGRPNGFDDNYSLKFLVQPLSKLLNQKVLFSADIRDLDVLNTIKPGEILLLENLRFYPEETQNDLVFAELLSKYGDIYVNDAFGTSHRKHASIQKIQEFFSNKSYMGFLLEKELSELKKIQQSSLTPQTVIVGGSKIGSKIHILKTFLNKADNILIGGGMAFPFIKFMGGKIGGSLCKHNEVEVVKKFLFQAKKSTTKIILPIDCVVTDSISSKTNIKYCDIMSIPDGYMGVDIGDFSVKLFRKYIANSKLILWNGPMGIFEAEEFSAGTKEITNAVSEFTANSGYSLIGGGDTVSAISEFGEKSQFSYISTGGGAMLDFFRNQNLPGIMGLKTIIT